MKRAWFVVGTVLLGISALGAGVAEAQNGNIVAWGRNEYGQLDVPEPNENFVAVSGGHEYSLGLKSNGTIVAWGYNDHGQLNIPVPNEDFVAVAAGGWHGLGRKSNGTLVAWGNNWYGQRNIPTPNADFISVSGGQYHSLGLKSDGTIVAWGAGKPGQSVPPHYGQCVVPEPNESFIAVAAGFFHSLGLKNDGSIVAWGRNDFDQLNIPEPNEDFVAIAGGYGHSLGLKSDGTIAAWGSNEHNQLDVPEPNEDFIAVLAGHCHSLGLKSDGTVVAWGANFDGQRDVPAPNSGFIAVAGGSSHSLGIRSLGPKILAVDDVPNDQGGWVRLTIQKSRLDDPLETEYPISAYNVWQRIDDPEKILPSWAEDGAATNSDATMAADSDFTDFPGFPLMGWKGRRFLNAKGLTAAGSFPPGMWELLGSYAACQHDQYIYRASTLADSTANGIPWSVYAVSAHTTTPAIWFASAPDSGYSVDNLPPMMPKDLAGKRTYQPSGLELTWAANRERDLAGYRVYRGLGEDFSPDPLHLIASLGDTLYFDDEWEYHPEYHYKVSALDVNGNESKFALLRPEQITGAGPSAIPLANYLMQNFPNPFNPGTRIAFGLTEPAHVSLRIYDASGRLVRVLIDEPRGAARHEEVWDGRDSAGRAAASGVYFYRLDAGPYRETKSMALLR